MALQVLAVLADIARIFLCAYMLTGGISLWHIFTVLGVSVVIHKCENAAKKIVDFKDPKEVRELQHTFPGLTLVEMLERYPIETILQHDLVALDTLRCRFATSSWESEFALLRPHADSLLAARVITPEMHRLLVADDFQGLRQMMPGNTIALERLFQA